MLEVAGTQVFTEIDEIVDSPHTALIVVDVQNDFCSDEGVAGRKGKNLSIIQSAVPRIREVLAGARRAGVTIIYIQNIWLPSARAASGAWLRFILSGKIVDLAEGWSVDGSWGAEIVSEIAPEPGDLIVRKHRSSAFFGTSLDTLLRCNGIKSVVCVGFVTDGCLESTARDAVFHDYYTVVLEDCVGTYERDLHEAALRVLRVRVDVVPSQTVLSVWSRLSNSAGQAKLQTA